MGRLETSEDFKVSEKTKVPEEIEIENLKITVRELTKEDIKTRNLPNQTTGLLITKIEKNSSLFTSVEVNSIILEAQKRKLETPMILNKLLIKF